MHSHLTRFDRIARHLWLGVAVVYTIAVIILGGAIGVSAL